MINYDTGDNVAWYWRQCSLSKFSPGTMWSFLSVFYLTWCASSCHYACIDIFWCSSFQWFKIYQKFQLQVSVLWICLLMGNSFTKIEWKIKKSFSSTFEKSWFDFVCCVSENWGIRCVKFIKITFWSMRYQKKKLEKFVMNEFWLCFWL